MSFNSTVSNTFEEHEEDLSWQNLANFDLEEPEEEEFEWDDFEESFEEYQGADWRQDSFRNEWYDWNEYDQQMRAHGWIYAVSFESGMPGDVTTPGDDSLPKYTFYDFEKQSRFLPQGGLLPVSDDEIFSVYEQDLKWEEPVLFEDCSQVMFDSFEFRDLDELFPLTEEDVEDLLNDEEVEIALEPITAIIDARQGIFQPVWRPTRWEFKILVIFQCHSSADWVKGLWKSTHLDMIRFYQHPVVQRWIYEELTRNTA